MAKQLNVDLNFTADTSKAKQQINELQQAIQKLGYGSAPKDSLINPADFEKASVAARELAFHLNNAYNTKTGNLDLSRLHSSLQQSGTSLNELTANFKNAGAVGQQAFVSLAKSIAMADQPSITLNTHLSTMFTTLKNVARFQISSSIMHGLIGGVQTAYNYAQDLNESLNNIRIVTGQNAEEMARFAKEANNAARNLNSTTLDYTNASLIYYQQGLDDAAVAERTEATLKLANVSRQSAETVSDQMTAIWNNFDDGSHSLEYYADVITALGAATASSSQEISQGLSKFAAIADTVGLSYENATSALATIVATTRQSADTVGTGLRTLFSRLQGLSLGETLEDGVDLNKYSKALATVGVQALDAQGNLRKMDDVLADLGERWGDLSEAQQTALAQTVGGVRQYTTLIALMDNWDFMKENQKIAAGAEGTLDAQADIYAESWEAARDRVRAAVESIYDTLIDEDFFISVDKAIEHLLVGVNNFLESFGGIKSVVLAVGSFIAASIATKISPAITKVIDDIKILTGHGQAVYGEMQNKFNTIVDQQIASGSYSETSKAELRSSQELLLAKTKLGQIEDKLSASEKMRASIAIQGYQMQAEEIKKLAAEVESLTQKQQEAANELLEAEAKRDEAKQNLDMQKGHVMSSGTALDKTGAQAMFSDSGLDFNSINKNIDITVAKLRDGLKQAFLSGNEEAVQLNTKLSNLGNSFKDIGKGVTDDNLGQRISELKYMKQIYGEFFKETSLNSKELEAVFNKAFNAKSPKEFSDATKDLGKMLNHANIPAEKLQKALIKLGAKPETLKRYNQALAEFKAASAAADNAKGKSDAANKKLEKATEDLAKAQAKLNEEVKQFDPQHGVTGIEAIVKGAAGLGQVVTLFNSFKSAINSFTDSSASLGERITSLFLAISMGVPAAIGAFKSFSDTFSYLTTTFPAVQAGITAISTAMSILTAKSFANVAASRLIATTSKTETATAIAKLAVKKGLISAEKQDALATNLANLAKEKGTALSAKDIITTTLLTATTSAEAGAHSTNAIALFFQAAGAIAAETAMSPLLVVVLLLVAALGALALIGYAVVKMVQGLVAWYNKDATAAKNSAEAAKELKEAYENTKKAYEDLQNTISKYQEAQKALKTLTKGTTEWRDQLRAANEEALKLLKLYPELNQGNYVKRNEDGLIEISQEGLDMITEKQSEEVDRAYTRSIMADAKAQQAQAKADMTAAQRENHPDFLTTAGISLLTNGIGGLLIGASNVINDGKMEKAANSWAEYDEDVRGKTDEELARLWEVAVDLVPTIKELGDNIRAAGDAFETAAEETTRTLLENNEKVQNSKYGDDVAVFASDKYQEVYDEKYSQIYALSMDDPKFVMDQYSKELGLDQLQGYKYTGMESNGNATYEYVDENGEKQEKTMTNEQIAAVVASTEAEKDLVETANQITDILDKLNANTEAQLVALKTGDIKNMTMSQMNEDVDFSDLSEEDMVNLGLISKSDAFWKREEKNRENLEEQMEEQIEEAKKAFLKDIRHQYGSQVKKIAKDIMEDTNGAFKDITQDTLVSYSAALGEISKSGGEDAVNSFHEGMGQLLNQNKKDSDKILNIANNIDWTKGEESLQEFHYQLKLMGIEIDENSAAWKDLVTSMEQINLSVVNSDLDGLRTKLVEMSDLAKDVKMGSIISDEEYDKIIQLDASLADLFTMTADGYQYNGLAPLSAYTNQMSKDAMLSQMQTNNQARQAAETVIEYRNAAETESYQDDRQYGIFGTQGNGGYAASEHIGGMDQVFTAIGRSEDYVQEHYGFNDRKGMFGGLSSEQREADIAEDTAQMDALVENYNAGMYDNQNTVDMYASNLLNSASNLEQLQQAKAEVQETIAELQAGGEDIEFNAELYSGALVRLAEQFDNTADEIEKYKIALQSGTEEEVKAAEQALEMSIAIGEAAQRYGFDVQETENYAKRLSKTYEEQGMSAEAAAKMGLNAAIANQRLDRGLTNLNKNLKDYKNKITAANKGSSEWSKSMDDLKTDLGDILNMDATTLTDEFAEAALSSEDLQKAMTGDIEAIKRLQEQAAEDMVLNISANLEGADLEKFTSQWEYLKANMAEGISSPDVNQEQLLASFNEMIAAGHMTKEQIEGALAGLHVSANVVTTYVPQKVTVPQTITEEAMLPAGTDKVQVPGPDGEWIDQTVTLKKKITRTYDAGTVEVDGVVPQYSIEGTEGPGGMTTAFAPAPTLKPSKSATSGGSGGGGGGGGGGGSQKSKDISKADRSHRYHTVKKQQDDVNNKQDEINRKRERSFGAAQIAQIKEEIKLQKEKIILQRQYLDEIGEYLLKDRQDMLNAFSGLSISLDIDKNGIITNYKQVQEELLKQTQALEEQYNAGGLDDDAFEEAKKKIDEAQEALSNYEETIDLQKEQMIALQEYIDDLADKALELATVKVELNISIIEDQFEFLDYMLSKIQDNAYSAAEAIALLGEQTRLSMKKAEEYEKGIADILSIHGINSMSELVGMTDEQLSKVGFTQDEIAKLREYKSALLEINQALKEQRQTMIDLVTDSLDYFNEQIDMSYGKFDYYNDVLTSFYNITDLLGAKLDTKTRQAIKVIQNMQLKNLETQSLAAKEIYEGAVQRYELAKEQYESIVKQYGATSDQALQYKTIMDNASEAMDEAKSQWITKYEETLQQAKDVFEKAMEEIALDFENSLTEVYTTFDLFNSAYDRAKTLQEDYLQDYQSIYELNKLNRDIQKEVEATNSLRDRKALRDMQKEITRLQAEGVQLSQYDVEALRKKFELEQARMDLEEARNNKSEVRLTRDQNGNWGYVYTAAEDKIADAEQRYEDALYNYQQLSDEYIKNLEERIKDLPQKYLDAMQEIYESDMDESQRTQALKELEDQFFKERNYLLDQYKGVTGNLHSTLDLMKELYGKDGSLHDSWDKLILGDMSGYSSPEEFLNALYNSIKDYNKKSTQALTELQETNDRISKANGLSITELTKQSADLGKTIDGNKEKVTTMVKEVTDSFAKNMKALSDWEREEGRLIDSITTKYENLANSLNHVIDRLAILESYSNQDFNEAVSEYLANRLKGGNMNSEKVKSTSDKILGPYDTGGYTGEWGPDGKLGILHQKEYVLNADTTDRFFTALGNIAAYEESLATSQTTMTMLYDAINNIQSISNTIGLLAERMNAGGILDNWLNTSVLSNINTNDQLEQNVHIDATFPNVQDHNEIEMAFDNLVNKASQYANRKDLSSMTFQDSYLNQF